MAKIIQWLFYFLLFCFILPSGSILGIPLKMLTSLLLIGCIAFSYTKIIFDKYTKYVLIILLLIGIWSIPAYINGYSTSLSFIKSFFSLLFIVWVTYELTKYKVVDNRQTKKVVKWICIVIVLVKLILEMGLMANIFSINSLVLFYKNILDCDLTTMYLPIGPIMGYRLMVSNDAIPLACFAFYLLSNDKCYKKVLSIIAMAAYTFIIYSRVIMIQYLAIVLLYGLIMAINHGLFDKKNIWKTITAILSILIVGVFVITISDSGIIENIKQRFFSYSTIASDSIRDEQKRNLMNGIYENVLFGHGTGSYIKDYIRSATVLYSYEMEYLSFVYQFGVIGFLLIIGGTIYMFYKLCFKKQFNLAYKLMLFLNFFIWVIKPAFNPNFLSSNSGMIVATIMVFVAFNNNKNMLEDTE